MRLSVKYGIAAGLLSGSLFYCEYFTGLYEQSNGFYSRMISILLLIMCIFLAIRSHYNHHNNGTPFTTRMGLKEGLIVTSVCAVMMALFTVGFHTIIAPDHVETLIEKGIDKMKEEGKTKEEIQQAVESFRSMFSPYVQAAMSIMFTLIMGLVSSFILTMLIRKTPLK